MDSSQAVYEASKRGFEAGKNATLEALITVLKRKTGSRMINAIVEDVVEELNRPK